MSARKNIGSQSSPGHRVGVRRARAAAPSLGHSSSVGFSEGDITSATARYLAELPRLEVMKPYQEIAMANHIAELKLALWKAIYGYPPFVEALRISIGATLVDVELPKAELNRVTRSARALRDRPLSANTVRHERAVIELAHKLAELDRDGQVAQFIVADLRRIRTGETAPVTLHVRRPRSGSQPFRQYVETCEQILASLHDAKKSFAKANLRLAVAMAYRFNHGHLPLADLIQEANIGLMKAVDRFDARKGFRFSTYATWWIRHAITRAIANTGRTVRVPAHLSTTFFKIAKARQKLETELGQTASSEDVAQALDISAEKVEWSQRARYGAAVSIDTPTWDDTDRSMQDVLADDSETTVDERLVAKGDYHQLRQALASLRPIEADILRKRFGLDDEREHTLKEVGEQHSLSRERIRQLEDQALKKIRRQLMSDQV